MVRCKFICDEKLQTTNGYSVVMIPVTHGSTENENFFKWTPWGKLEIGVISDEVIKKFEVGKEYYLDITLVQ